MKKIGLIVNPIAGIGGRAGYKGSDNPENQKKALNAGYEKAAWKRASECLQPIKGLNGYQLFSPTGEMGGDILEMLEIPYRQIYIPVDPTTQADTHSCLERLMAEKVDLIVFCGGDGTARDVCAVCGHQLPVLGIPAGVKMYSGCFAVNPRIAGNLLKDYILGKNVSLELREVMDLDEAFLGRYSVNAKLYGYLLVLNQGASLQGPKVASAVNPFEAEILAEEIVSKMQEDVLYIIGPGSTTYKIKKRLGVDGTLIGVDAVKNRQLIAKDADERTLLCLIAENPSVKIIVTCIGGAGFVFGRGNQQISAKVIERVGKENIQLAVTKSKLLSLNQRPMYVDTGDAKIDSYLTGYYRIPLSSQESTVYKIQNI